MKFIYFFLLSLLFIGCSSTSLNYQKDIITLSSPHLEQKIKGKTLQSSQINLSQISVQQRVFQSDSHETLVYEYARLETAYKFKYNYVYILTRVFDAKKVEVVQNKDGLGFFIIRLKDDSLIYTLAKTGTKKSLTMVYGFSEESFKALVNNTKLVKQDLSLQREEDGIRSVWNMKLIIMGDLLEKDGGKFWKR